MKLKGLLKVALVLLAISTMFVACDTLAGGKWARVENVYMKPSATADADSVYYVWNWGNGADGKWSTQLTLNEDGLYVWAVPEDADNCIFVEMEAETTEPDWSAKVAQTADLVIPLAGDTKVVYSIASKEWIELGAKEPEPEPEPEPVVCAVAISATEFTSLKYAAQSGPTDIELDGDKSFTFYANAKTYKFKYTDGTWSFTAVTGEAITELDKEYPIVKKGDTGYGNIELKNLTKGAEYKVTLTHKDDGFAYVKVHATGEVYTPPATNGIVYTPEDGKIYMLLDGVFLSGNGDERFAAYFYGDGDVNAWVEMNAVEDVTNLYEVAVPTGKNFTKVIFVRMNGSTTENNWDNKWNQTDDLTIPTDVKVCCTISAWDGQQDNWFAFATE